MTSANPFEQALSRRRQRGFTLIELLVVVFIIGLMSGYVMLSVRPGHDSNNLDQEMRRLHGLLRLASQQAILQGWEVGLLVYHDHYEFVVAGRERWESPPEGSVLKAQNLPSGWWLELTQDGQPTPPLVIKETAEEEDEETTPEKPTPQIIFFSSGEGTAFELRMHSDEGVSTSTIRGEESGNLELASHASQA